MANYTAVEGSFVDDSEVIQLSIVRISIARLASRRGIKH